MKRHLPIGALLLFILGGMLTMELTQTTQNFPMRTFTPSPSTMNLTQIAQSTPIREGSEQTLNTFTLTATPILQPTGIPSSTPTVIPRITQSSISFTGRITSPRLNVRSSANSDAYIVFRLSEGDNVPIIGRNSTRTWLLIDVGVVGWVNADYVSISGNLNRLQVYQANEPLPPSERRIVFVCESARGPSFHIGDRFVVPYGDGPTSIWAEPNQEPRITQVLEGQQGEILGGPICTGAQQGFLVFWYVRTNTGFEGYISEGYQNSPIPWIEPNN